MINLCKCNECKIHTVEHALKMYSRWMYKPDSEKITMAELREKAFDKLLDIAEYLSIEMGVKK